VKLISYRFGIELGCGGGGYGAGVTWKTTSLFMIEMKQHSEKKITPKVATIIIIMRY